MSTSSTAASVVRMANQIAINFASQQHEAAATATADHIATFWDPRMRAIIFEVFAAGGAGLTPIAADAIAILHKTGAPPPQTPATVFEPGRSDAG